MKPQMIWANLVSKDIARTTGFYTALGFAHSGHSSEGMASFKFGDAGFIINFFLPERTSYYMKMEEAALSSGNEVMFSLSASTKEEVQEWVQQVTLAGGTVFTPAGEDKNGFYGCGFADPDGHKFNVVVMQPGM